METLVITVDAHQPEPRLMAQAAAVLKAGGLVAFPTETVYGLGANALDVDAVERIFVAKGRPATNPLIVHASDLEGARRLAAEWPAPAQRLATHFWPGPLTLVVRKNSLVPDLVTAGGPTVALRVPAHPVALALLEACQLPLAAPSANRSSRLSPTRPDHVLAGLDGRIDMLLDAGATWGGVESTVMDLTCSPPRLLRPGLVAPAEVEAIIGPIERKLPKKAGQPMKSPGLMDRHYAPVKPMECVPEDGGHYVRRLRASGSRPGWLTFVKAADVSPEIPTIVLPSDSRGYAAGLFAALHKLEAAPIDRIVVALPPHTEEWLAVLDRLKRACAR